MIFIKKNAHTRSKKPKKSPAARYRKETINKSLDHHRLKMFYWCVLSARRAEFFGGVFFRPKGGKFLGVIFAARRAAKFFSTLSQK